MSVSVVVPAHNAAAFITGTLRDILANASVSQVVVVDDGSRDTTADLVQAVAQVDARVMLIRLYANRGAGVARNIGFAAVRGDFTMFLDADDFLASGAIDEVHAAIAQSTSDVALYRYKFCRRGPHDATCMHPADHRFWDVMPTHRLAMDVDFESVAGILTTVNFPWNKIARTSYLQRIGVRFSESFVFNDMLGHWLIYLNASNLLLYNKTLLFHRVDESRGPQLTTTSDRRKLEVFKAFRDVEAVFEQDRALLRHYPFFLFYKLEVLVTIAHEIAGEHYDAFIDLVAASYRLLDAERMAIVAEAMPEVARLSVDAKSDPRRVFARPEMPAPSVVHPPASAPAAPGDFQSSAYWQQRYQQGGNSGAGSRGRLADFKATFINAFVEANGVGSVVELGCGDGDQLAKYTLPAYVGVDVSAEMVARCKTRFGSPSHRFVTYDDLHEIETADLAMSIDVIFHLVEDDVFERYMSHLFAFGRRYVVIYSSNCDAGWPDRHVRHRHVTAHVEKYFPEWTLAAHVPNAFPYDQASPDTTSFADFFVFTNPWQDASRAPQPNLDPMRVH